MSDGTPEETNLDNDAQTPTEEPQPPAWMPPTITEGAPQDGEPFDLPWIDPERDYRPGYLPVEVGGTPGEIQAKAFRIARWFDRLQARVSPFAFGYSVFKKYADDEGSRLAGLMAYYTFLSIFPLAIGGLAALNLFLADRPEVVEEVIEAVIPLQYQSSVIEGYQSLPDSGPALAVALVGLLLAGTAGLFSVYAAFNQIFAVPYRFRYGFGPRYLRIIALIFVVGIGVLVIAVGSIVIGSVDFPGAAKWGVFILTWAVGYGLLYLMAKVLMRRKPQPREIRLGSALGALLVNVILMLGTVLISGFVTGAAPIYGAFATVVGIVAVLILVSNAVIISMEISVVRAWQLWPRCTDIHVLFPADDRAFALLSLMDERMPSQRNGVMFDAVGHDDPRRPPLSTLDHRQPGLPLTRYDVADADTPYGEVPPQFRRQGKDEA